MLKNKLEDKSKCLVACAVCHSGQLDNTIKLLVRLLCTATTFFLIQVEIAWVCGLELMGSNRVFVLCFLFIVGLETEKGNAIYKQDVHHTFDAPINRMSSFPIICTCLRLPTINMDVCAHCFHSRESWWVALFWRCDKVSPGKRLTNLACLTNLT